MRKVEEGEGLRDPSAYCYGIARLVLLEALKRQTKEEKAAQEYHRTPSAEDDGGLEDRLRCLRRCLNELPAAQQQLVAAYYQGSGSERIDGRRRLAESLGIGMNALRIRAFRLSDKLQDCITGCVGGPGPAKWSGDV